MAQKTLTLDTARIQFDRDPTNETAGMLLQTAMEDMNDDTIDDDDFLDAVSTVREFLMGPR
jgi:hypothetical protein